MQNHQGILNGLRLVGLVEHICIDPSATFPRLSSVKCEVDETLNLLTKFGNSIPPTLCKRAVEIASAARIPLLVSVITKYCMVPPRRFSQKMGKGIDPYESYCGLRITNPDLFDKMYPQNDYDFLNEDSNFVEYLSSLNIDSSPYISNLEISELLEPHILNYELISIADEICKKSIAETNYSDDLTEAERLIEMGADIHYEKERFIHISSLYRILEMYLFSVKHGANWKRGESFGFLSSCGIDPYSISSTEELLNILTIHSVHRE